MDGLRFELRVFSGAGNTSMCIFPFPWSFFPSSSFPSSPALEGQNLGCGKWSRRQTAAPRADIPSFPPLPRVPTLVGHCPEFTPNSQPCTGSCFGVGKKTLPLALHPAKGEVGGIRVFPGGKAVFSLGKKPYFPWEQRGNSAAHSKACAAAAAGRGVCSAKKNEIINRRRESLQPALTFTDLIPTALILGTPALPRTSPSLDPNPSPTGGRCFILLPFHPSGTGGKTTPPFPNF